MTSWRHGRVHVLWADARKRRRAGSLISIATLTVVLLAAGPSNAATKLSEPRHYYLALGDSLTFGFQAQKMSQELATETYDPATFASFADTFAYGTTMTGLGVTADSPSLSTIDDDVQLVNLSCAGETALSFITVSAPGPYGGPCPYHRYNGTTHLALHNDYPDSQSQLDAAIAFLHDHRGEVTPITLNIGSNELNRLFTACQAPGSASDCVSAALPAVINEVRLSLETILSQLHRAAPYADIFVFNLADPFTNLPPAPLFDPAFVAMNQGAIEPAVAASRDHLIDIYTRVHQFSLGETCAYILICTNGDIHPTDLGYAYLGQYLWKQSGYADFLQQGNNSSSPSPNRA